MDIDSSDSPAHRKLDALDHFKQPCAQYVRRRDEKRALLELFCCQRYLSPFSMERKHIDTVNIIQ